MLGFVVYSIIFMLWIAAYILFAVGVSFVFDGDFGEAVLCAAAAAGFWGFGFWIYSVQKKPNTHKRYTFFCLFAGAVFLIALILLAIGEAAVFFASLGLVAACFYIILKYSKQMKGELPDQSEAPKQSSPVAKDEDNEFRKVINQGYQYIQNLKQLRLSVQDENIVDQIVRLETISQQVVEFIEANPKQVAKLNKFLDYYFPTSLKFLESYISLSNKPVKGENVIATLDKIAQGLLNIEKAFEQLLNNLYEDKVMDMDSELALLQQSMAIEGLGLEDPF